MQAYLLKVLVVYLYKESRQMRTEWAQVTGENKARGEFSFFKAYSSRFEEEDIGSWPRTE